MATTGRLEAAPTCMAIATVEPSFALRLDHLRALEAESIHILREVVAEFERLGMRVYAARAMVDLGRAMVRAGQEPQELLTRARDILTECDARLFLFEVDEVTAD